MPLPIPRHHSGTGIGNDRERDARLSSPTLDSTTTMKYKRAVMRTSMLPTMVMRMSMRQLWARSLADRSI